MHSGSTYICNIWVITSHCGVLPEQFNAYDASPKEIIISDSFFVGMANHMGKSKNFPNHIYTIFYWSEP